MKNKFDAIIAKAEKVLAYREVPIDNQTKRNMLADFKRSMYITGTFELKDTGKVNTFQIVMKETPALMVDQHVTRDIERIAKENKGEQNYDFVWVIVNIDKTHSAVEFQAI